MRAGTSVGSAGSTEVFHGWSCVVCASEWHRRVPSGVDGGVVAIDATKLGADVWLFANRTKERLAAEMLAEAERIDADDDERLGDCRGDELPETWARPGGCRAWIRAALGLLESGARAFENRVAERGAQEPGLGPKLTGPKPTASPAWRTQPRRANTTDPDSGIISPGPRGVLYGYNARGAATVEQIVVAAEVTTTTNDPAELHPHGAGRRREPRGRRARTAGRPPCRRCRLLERGERHPRGRRRRAHRDTRAEPASGAEGPPRIALPCWLASTEASCHSGRAARSSASPPRGSAT
jgi:hypothetical protein